MTELGELGLLGSTLPEKYGGSAVSHVAYGLIARAVERIDSGYRSAMSVQSSLVMYPIYAFGSEEQREKYLPGMAAGKIVGCFGLTEPDGGSDPASMRTSAKRVDGGYPLNGAKMWITNSPISDVSWSGPSCPTARSAASWSIAACEGLTTPKIEGKFSLRASITGEIPMDESSCPTTTCCPTSRACRPVRLSQQRPLRHRLGRHGRGGVLLARRAELHAGAPAVRPPAGPDPAGPEKLADMQTEIGLGLQGALRLGRLIDEGRGVRAISLMKRNNCGKALDIARVARDMHGGNGISDEYQVIRHAMNLEAVNTYEGTHDVHALILGRAQTGLQAFF